MNRLQEPALGVGREQSGEVLAVIFMRIDRLFPTDFHHDVAVGDRRPGGPYRLVVPTL